MTLIEQLEAVLEKILPAASYQCGSERFVTDNADTLRAALKDAERYREFVRDYESRDSAHLLNVCVDANRYRYLRSQPVDDPYGTPRIAIPSDADSGVFVNEKDADDAIDMAMGGCR